MPLSWNEIKHRAIAFSKEWKGETREDAEAKSFWDAFFNVFGIQRRTVASFEEPVKKLSGDWAYIDLFWPGTLLAEHKSAGKDLGKAHAQGMEYIRALASSGRVKESPRYLIVSDFQRIAIHDLEPEQDPDLPLLQRLPPSFEFPLADFHRHIRHFFFVAGYKQHKLNPEDPANEEATQLMCELHDALEEGEYGTDATGRAAHELKQFLVRLLFCLFGEDNGIFQTRAFQFYIQDSTAADGSDLGPKLGQLFEVLNTPEDRRQKNLDPDLLQFAYINGQLFAERLALPAFTSAMRGKVLACAAFDWSRISPAVFGSLFQAVMDAKERRQIGAHYTAERNILKVVRSLFLDEFRAEFEAAKRDKSGRGKSRLLALQKKLAALRFLDPACGCGNFLVITYRELRALELEILLELHTGQQQMGEADVFNLSLIDVDQMFGIEIEEFPARIAEVALWLTDHQANVRLSEAFGQFYKRIPLRKSPHIHVANALRLDWRTVLPPAQCSYVLGNPPFVGKKEQSTEQKADMDAVWGEVKGAGVLDFVTAWYRLAADYIHGTEIKVAFVSTNSISQGEQVSVLWSYLLSRFRVKIHFAHRTFAWESEARGKAHVHVVIIGFGLRDVPEKRLYDYDHDPLSPTLSVVSNISPYLIEGSNIVAAARSTPVCAVPEMGYGSFALDDGNYTLSRDDRDALLTENPQASIYLRPFIGGREMLHSEERWCLWLKDAAPSEIRKLPAVMRRVEAVQKWRTASGRETTQKLAITPTIFAEVRQPITPYLAIPTLSSVRRRYIPIGFLEPETIASNQLYVLPDATLFHFGVLHSAIHVAWVKHVAGRFKSDYRYSNAIVYNNYPWPEAPTPAQRSAVERAAQAVLDARAKFPASTLADLYDPLAMPPALATAHAALDRAVDKCYRSDPFPSDRARVEHLFALYEKITAPLAPTAKPRQKRAKGK
ncbi:MAG: class I SAM-dependent DNA methyltransferase [Verrucomicrobia bacterium]|nr:class I SAM-dependent DNA methyltransferase [Verrucomicrobiota bacterium]